MTRCVTLLMLTIGILEWQCDRSFAAVEIAASPTVPTVAPSFQAGLSGLLILNQAIRGAHGGERFGMQLPSPGLMRDTRIAVTFALAGEMPIAESQMAIAIEPLVDSVGVPEPMSVTIWVLALLAAICGPRAISRSR